MELHQLIGDKSQFSIQHRILNVILIFGIFISFWSVMTSYCLGLDSLSLTACIWSGMILTGVYYLSVVKRKYDLCIFLSLFLVATVIPFIWFTSGGTAGRVPFYIMLFSPMGVTVLKGYKRFLLTALLTLMALAMIIIEYVYPYLVTGYPTVTVKYIDVSITLLTSIITNSLLLTVILKHYDEEHQLAKKYLQESEKARNHLEYLSYHDALTGLYNRTFFEMELVRLETGKKLGLAVYVIDIDGLKFINDTIGHSQGDLMIIRAAQILRSSFPESTAIFRTGGDEYIALLEDVSAEQLEMYYQNVCNNMQKDNDVSNPSLVTLQMSIGYAYSKEIVQSIEELILEAENKMYREKTFHHTTNNRSMIQSVKEMLAIREKSTGSHGERLQKLIVALAKAAGVGESSMMDLRLLAKFHNIGKIGISNEVIKKPGLLTKIEIEEIQRHCEIGYRIARATSDLLPIAEWILRHHEWWNGKGYPLKLRGTDIPFECRILAIVDSYDAMTSNRPYRKAMNHDAAIEELQRYAGIQFDPELVKIFIGINQIQNNSEVMLN
ncbi:HD domain-containing phosphohydrolase [Pelosinus sp. sgz500959]|uniref:HD domain-containing phosphohydrolase n=1 Tax=Pelosinus sp. sgz500959 TaxID=3242472 RepID=UPI00366B6B1A